MTKQEKQNRIDKFKELRSQGMTYKEIGDALGINEGTIKSFAHSNGLADSKPRNILTKYEERHCDNCGVIFMPVNNTQHFCCDKCRWHYNKIHISREKKLIEPKQCANCAQWFMPKRYGTVYCSKNCARKAYNKAHRKDKRIPVEQVEDVNISIWALIKRDNNICWLCNYPCNLYDFEIGESGKILQGPWYPTIDHVLPISLGGKDSWDNIKLAHRRCNTHRGTKVDTSDGEGMD